MCGLGSLNTSKLKKNDTRVHLTISQTSLSLPEGLEGSRSRCSESLIQLHPEAQAPSLPVSPLLAFLVLFLDGQMDSPERTAESPAFVFIFSVFNSYL